MDEVVKTITVDSSNVAQEGFFCYKSKPKSEGYRRKLDWLEARFAEGMEIKILFEGVRSVAFIEYIPGEFAWRTVSASDYLFIHCLWVVGKGKGKGYASRLLGECVEAARRMGKRGVAMVTSTKTWLVDKKVLLKNGFEIVDQAPPVFELLVKRFDDAPLPTFPRDWEARNARYGAGLTIIRTDQCPYIVNAVGALLESARELGVPARVVELRSCQEVQEMSPSAYGVFNVVYDGKLLSYRYLDNKELRKLLMEKDDEKN